ncbi:MAG: SAM-dependent methyltransferase [Chthoniobacterales bacterium]|nr:MAG: SAM-dependent methyltransferase [Chthoniobacterales bacterium]
MSEETFQRYSAYYDLLYRDKDYETEADSVARALRAANPNTHSVLEFGSGTGRHGRLLAEHGFDVFGIERSQTMVTTARSFTDDSAVGRESGIFDCVQGDIQTTTLNRPFHAVLALFHVVSYQTTDADVDRTFANAARHLSADGIFFFDVWHGPAVLHERPAVREKRVEDATTLLTRLAEPRLDVDRHTVTVRYSITAQSKIDNQITEFQEEHCMRYFFPEEITSFARKTGFNVERSEEFLTAQPPSDRTWGVAYLLRKRT